MAQQALKKQDTFLWEGTDRKGARLKGETLGASISLVKADLRRQGINPLKVKKKPKSLFGSGERRKKIKPKDIALFSRQMATMMSSGVPLVQSFDIVAKGVDNLNMADLVNKIKNDVESGSTFAEALSKHPYYFDELYVNLVTAGEHAGILETLLEKIATYKEKIEEIKGKIKKALFYPAAVIIVAFIVTTILLLFVVPAFEEVFANFGAELPALTLAVINLSKWVQSNWYIMAAVIIGGFIGIIQLKRRSVGFNHFMDRMTLKLPIIGNIIEKATIARFARTLSTMFAAGVPLVEAMESVAGAAGNIVYSKAILKMRDEIATGQQLQQSMRMAGLFPNMVVQMVAIGEESGSLDSMLAKVADFYEAEVDNAVDSLSSLLEPLIMAFLGVVIGGLVIAMYLPIFKLGAVV
jgi:type IV pilus assembly protein PilC